VSRHSWADIGRAVGISRQAAHKRFRPDPARLASDCRQDRDHIQRNPNLSTTSQLSLGSPRHDRAGERALEKGKVN
jgi:hypothetical protein